MYLKDWRDWRSRKTLGGCCLKAMDFAWTHWGMALVLCGLGALFCGVAQGQAGPPSPTIQETPTLQNETLSHVTYDNRYEIYGGPAFSHFNGGPSLIQGTNLGGFDVQFTRWFNKRFGATVNGRGYYGTQAVVPNALGIHGPFIYEHQFLGGITMRGIRNQHASIDLHAFGGGAYGVFDAALNPGVTPQQMGMFANQMAPAVALGGSLDLNRSQRWALRLSPDYLLTRFGGTSQNEFAISVGVVYRFARGGKVK